MQSEWNHGMTLRKKNTLTTVSAVGSFSIRLEILERPASIATVDQLHFAELNMSRLDTAFRCIILATHRSEERWLLCYALLTFSPPPVACIFSPVVSNVVALLPVLSYATNSITPFCMD
jgi:hypothetical protein